MRILNYVMAGLFIFGALVQVNDPDPFAWMAIYIAAGTVSYLANRRPRDFITPAIVAVVAGVCAAALSAGATAPVLGLFEEWEMQNQTIEVTREHYGLAIISLWMVVLTIRAVRNRKFSRPDEAVVRA